MIRLANIKPGFADVLCDGALIGWVIQTEWDDVDDDGRATGYVYDRWEAVHPDEYSGGVSFDLFHRRRDAVAAVVERHQREGVTPAPRVT